MKVTFGYTRSKRGLLQRPALLIAAVRVVLLAGLLISLTNELPGATAAEVVGHVFAPVVGEYDVENPTTATFRFNGTINMSSADGWIAIDVLKDPNVDPQVEQNWELDVGRANIIPAGSTFRFASSPLRIFRRTNSGGRPWLDGGLGRARVAFVFRNNPNDRRLLTVQDVDGFTPQNPNVIVLADVAPDRTNQEPNPDTGDCGVVQLDQFNANKPTNPCTPNYLSANTHAKSFTPGNDVEQVQATTDYYNQVRTAPNGGGGPISNRLQTLSQFQHRYFERPQCNDSRNEPEAVTTYYNKGDLGIGREMHCSYNQCNMELACYVKNFGRRDGQPFFGDKEEAQVAVEKGKPFATVAMVERRQIKGSPNSVFFAVYDQNGALSGSPTSMLKEARLDRKGYNTSIPGNCLQCHGINSSYTIDPSHEVRRAIFLPFDLDSFEFFSDDPRHSRASQEGAFRAQNRMVLNHSRLGDLPDAQKLIGGRDGWYHGNLRTGTFDGTSAPPEWMGNDQQKQLHDRVYARACRTCHISYEPAPPGEMGDTRPGLQFGTYQQFLDNWGPLINIRTCGPINLGKTMPNAEQTLQLFWTTEARAQLFAQLPNRPDPDHPPDFGLAYRDCPPFSVTD